MKGCIGRGQERIEDRSGKKEERTEAEREGVDETRRNSSKKAFMNFPHILIINCPFARLELL